MRSVMVFPGLLFLLLISISSAQENNTRQDKDPLDSFMWELYQDRYLSNAPVHFDSRVKITAPDFAEDSGQVPVEIDASHLNGKFDKMLLWVELNPIPMVFEYNPGTQGLAKVGLNIRLEQGSPVRVALLSQGEWHVGSTFIDGAGGGCSTPGIANSGKNWSKDFGQVRARRFPADNGSRLRFLIMHPMESGLLPSEIPFYIEELTINSGGESVADMKWHASISENPVLTIEMKGDKGTTYKLRARDNNANVLESEI
ncbi:quinoprotein dehydrogenase-associated SoxYZ-like carrier [Alcanivorax sp.]|uniref:quinoprotein dehydrogenase-associated SoxYZ-like carrier n=2 Tax=unclassified Alcanivorax TaxID=2638842 RepID=UPI003A90EA58